MPAIKQRKIRTRKTSKRQAKKHKKPVPLDVRLLAVVLLLLGVAVAADISGFFSREEFVEANVVNVQDTTIILGRDCRAIIADTTPDQARSIRLGLEKRIEVRPTTHDLYVETLKNFNISVVEVAMLRFEDNIYFGEIVMRSGDRVLRLDARPSDGIAIALRTGSPILINKTVLEQQGKDICQSR